MDPRRVWVLGAGAVGSAVAGLLRLGGRAEPRLVGASPHWRRVRREGLWLERPDREPELVALAAPSWEELPALGGEELALLAGKAVDLPAVARRLAGRLNGAGGVIALQNGLGVREEAARLLGRPVEGGLAFFGARSATPGRVSYYGPGRLVLSPAPACQALAAVLEGPELECRVAEDYRAAQWTKLATNCLANPLAGILNRPNRELRGPELDRAKQILLDEVKAVARAEGVKVELTVEQFNRRLKGDNVPSLRTDLDRGRPTEIEFLNGAVARLARRHGVPAPANELLCSLVRFLERAG
jgi:2-dehydropantoate 2-reductase